MTIAEAKKNKDQNCEILTVATIVEFITQTNQNEQIIYRANLYYYKN